MSLIKDTYIEDLGITASYWKVKYVSLDTDGQEGNFSLGLYTKKGMKNPLKSYCVVDMMGNSDKTLYKKYFGEDRGKNYKDWQTACYCYVKDNIEFFKDAIDDEEEIALLRD